MDVNELLIEEVIKHECLFDLGNKNYKNIVLHHKRIKSGDLHIVEENEQDKLSKRCVCPVHITEVMSRRLVATWRESASVIILVKDKLLRNGNCNYKVLLFNRTDKASFLPSSYVFPGGVCEVIDESPVWLDHFQSFGISGDKFKLLTSANGPRPNLFKKKHGTDCLPKEISLRITALRETFEETGILLCRRRGECIADNILNINLGRFCQNFDKKHWQELVHNDATQFLTLCRTLDVMPDLWNLHEWSAWLTPTHFPKRFETAFFLIGLDEMPDVILEEGEGKSFTWETPFDVLKSYLNEEIWLPPPQFYELSRLLNFSQLDDLLKFARNRAQKGTILILPVQRQCIDGMVSLLPGDDMYPENVNESDEIESTQNTLDQYRLGVKKLHRFEYINMGYPTIHLNFTPADGHGAPLSIYKTFAKM